MEKKFASGKTVTNPILLKDLYRTYYRENWRAARIILTVLSVLCFIAAMYFYSFGFGTFYMLAAIWLGLIFVIYPRNAFRRPYKRVKNEVSVVFFSFYDDKMKEKAEGETNYFNYNDIYLVMDAPKYIYFFHTKRDVSVLDKSGINSGSAENIINAVKGKAKRFKKTRR